MPAPGQIQIRRAGLEECGVISSVLHESFVEYKPLYTSAGFAATALHVDQVKDRMREGPVWVAARDGVVVGTVSALLKGEAAYLRGMAVLPAARGSGAGSRLLQEVESWASAEGCFRLFLSTTLFLDSAIRLYERFGFGRTEKGPNDLYGTPLFTMSKHVRRQK